MKYQIINYNTDHKYLEVKVAETSEALESAQILTISLDRLLDLESLEKLILQTYVANLSVAQRGSYSAILEDYVSSNINAVQDMSISIPTGIDTIVSSRSDAVVEDTTATTVRII